MEQSNKRSSKWNIKNLVFCHLSVLFLVWTLFFPPVQQFFWKPVDESFFKLLKSLIEESHFWQTFWAMANHRMADFLEDFVFIAFFLWVLKTTPYEQRKQKTAEFLFLLLYAALIILLINDFVFRQCIHIKRHSPSLVLDSFTRLSEQVTWLKVKDKASNSFPADHATTALIFIGSFLYLSKKKRIRLATCLYGVFLCIPRLIAGAHWLSDILVGSFSILLILGSWAFYTPFASFFIEKIKIFISSTFFSLKQTKT